MMRRHKHSVHPRATNAMVGTTVVLGILLFLTIKAYRSEAFLPAISPLMQPAHRMRPTKLTRFMSTPTKEDEGVLTKEKNDTRSELNNMILTPPEEEMKKNGVKDKEKADAIATYKDVDAAPKKMNIKYDELDGEAKVEEPGESDKIMSLIKQYEFDVWKSEPQLPVEVIVQRTLDTAEDAFLHLRRVPYDKGWFLKPEKEDRPTIVVLGSGWAAHALLKVADTYKMRIIVVSPSNHFVFTPMLASASVGTVEYRSMTEAVRAANPMIENYIEGTAMDIDVEQKTLKVKLNSLLEGIKEPGAPEIEIEYDKLVVGEYCSRVLLVSCSVWCVLPILTTYFSFRFVTVKPQPWDARLPIRLYLAPLKILCA